MTLGYDVHPKYQKGIRFDQASGEFVWVKLTDGGSTYPDTATMCANALAAGKRLGGYCYGQPGDGGVHADLLVSTCLTRKATGLWPAIDIEDDKNIHVWSTTEATAYGRAFCARVRERGLRPVVYMNASKMQACRPDLWPENPVIWVARYPGPPDAAPRSSAYLGRWDVHQYSSSGNVPGSAGLVDMNTSTNNAHYATLEGIDMSEADVKLIVEQLTGNQNSAVDHVFPGWAVQAARPGAKAMTLVDYARQTYAEVKVTQVQLTALAAAVAASTNEPDITVEKLAEIVDQAVAHHMEITGTFTARGDGS